MAAVSTDIVDLVERAIGVSMIEGDVERLMPFARDRARALGLDGPAAYLEGVAGEPLGGREWALLIEAVTNGQTCFFRDRDQWDTIAELISAITAERPRPRVSLWSSACSTGEEPYTAAIVCAELGVDAEIVASDVNRASLSRAVVGHFHRWSLRHVLADRTDRWFTEAPDGYVVHPRIRDAVRFTRQNLVSDPPLQSEHPDGRWDLVLCRNVLIYFRRERVAEVCRRLVNALSASGALVVAASESLTGLEVAARPELVGSRIVYRRSPVIESPAPVLPSRERPKSTVPAPLALEARSGLAPVIDRVAKLAIGNRIGEARSMLLGALAGNESGVDKPGVDKPGVDKPGVDKPGVDKPGVEEPGVEAELALGHLDACEHDFCGALEHYLRATEIDNLLAEAHYFVGVSHRKSGRWPEASEAFRRALFLAPTFWQASYMLSGAFRRLGRQLDANREEARTRKLLASDPPIIALLSHPLFVDRLGVSADAVRELWSINQSGSV